MFVNVCKMTDTLAMPLPVSSAANACLPMYCHDMGASNGILGSQLHLGPALGTVAIQRVNLWMEEVCLRFSFSLPFK